MTTLAPRRAWTLAISDTAVMTRRYLHHYLRKPSLLGIALVQPVLLVLLWTYVFSGAIQTPGGIDYVDYLMPGLFILAIAFGSANTGVGLADDLARGLIDRFRLSWISALIGLTVRDPETAGTASLLQVIPLAFVSSTFVPVAAMPGWLQAWANSNPITHAVDATRALAFGGPISGPLLQTIAWILGLLAVVIPLAIHRYRRVTQ
jgi:ABC-type polysaccharide/polyol phosphate export permease